VSRILNITLIARNKPDRGGEDEAERRDNRRGLNLILWGNSKKGNTQVKMKKGGLDVLKKRALKEVQRGEHENLH